MLPSNRPRWPSPQSIGLKTESSIHSQATADRATGVVQGSRTRNRTSHLPRKSATRMLARTLPRTTIRAIETTVNTKVLRRARQNTGSSRARRKVSRPAQWKLGSPAVTSLKANPMARKKGTATRATTYRIDGSRNQTASRRSLSAKRRAGRAPAWRAAGRGGGREEPGGGPGLVGGEGPGRPGPRLLDAGSPGGGRVHGSAPDPDRVGPQPPAGVEEPQPVGVAGELGGLPGRGRGGHGRRQPGDHPGVLADPRGRAVDVTVAGQVLDPFHRERHGRP